jgi:hypothetical protein
MRKNEMQEIKPSIGYTINIHHPDGKTVTSYFGSQIFETKEDALKYVDRRKNSINPYTNKPEIPKGSTIEIEQSRFDRSNPYYMKHYERHTHEALGGGSGHKNIIWDMDMDEFERNKEIPPLKSPHKFIKNTSLLERKKKSVKTKPKRKPAKKCKCKVR